MFEALILPFLQCPSMDLTHLLCPMDASMRTQLLESYYSIDGPVLREFLGNPVSSIRRSVEDVADTTHVGVKRCVCLSVAGKGGRTSLKGCRHRVFPRGYGCSCIRQCENIRRVMFAIDDMLPVDTPAPVRGPRYCPVMLVTCADARVWLTLAVGPTAACVQFDHEHVSTSTGVCLVRALPCCVLTCRSHDDVLPPQEVLCDPVPVQAPLPDPIIQEAVPTCPRVRAAPPCVLAEIMLMLMLMPRLPVCAPAAMRLSASAARCCSTG